MILFADGQAYRDKCLWEIIILYLFKESVKNEISLKIEKSYLGFFGLVAKLKLL